MVTHHKCLLVKKKSSLRKLACVRFDAVGARKYCGFICSVGGADECALTLLLREGKRMIESMTFFKKIYINTHFLFFTGENRYKLCMYPFCLRYHCSFDEKAVFVFMLLHVS